MRPRYRTLRLVLPLLVGLALVSFALYAVPIPQDLAVFFALAAAAVVAAFIWWPF